MPRHPPLALCVLLASVPAPALAACAQPGEPPLSVLSATALRSAALEPERVRSLLRRARVSALLPQLTARIGRDAYDSIRNADTLDPTLLTTDTLRWDVTLRFSLDRLIFDLHELRAAEAAGRLSDHRFVLLERVAALWSERRRLDLSHPPPLTTDDPIADSEASLRCTELTALLDALTGGALMAPTPARPNSLPRPPPRR